MKGAAIVGLSLCLILESTGFSLAAPRGGGGGGGARGGGGGGGAARSAPQRSAPQSRPAQASRPAPASRPAQASRPQQPTRPSGGFQLGNDAARPAARPAPARPPAASRPPAPANRPNGGANGANRPNGGNTANRPNGGANGANRPNGGNTANRPNGGANGANRPNGGNNTANRPNGGNGVNRPNGGNNNVNINKNTNVNISGNRYTSGAYAGRTVVVNPVYRVGPAYGWNHGAAWYPAPNYYGGGFWGALAIGVTSAAVGAAVYGSIVNSSTHTTYTSYQVQPSSPGATLLANYRLTQVQCGPPGLVNIYGPSNSVICATPNDLVSAGDYDIDSEQLSLVNR